MWKTEDKARRKRVGSVEETVEAFLARAKQEVSLENESYVPECNLHSTRTDTSSPTTTNHNEATPRVLAAPTSIDQISKQPSDLSKWIESKGKNSSVVQLRCFLTRKLGEIGCIVSEIEQEFSAISSRFVDLQHHKRVRELKLYIQSTAGIFECTAS